MAAEGERLRMKAYVTELNLARAVLVLALASFVLPWAIAPYTSAAAPGAIMTGLDLLRGQFDPADHIAFELRQAKPGIVNALPFALALATIGGGLFMSFRAARREAGKWIAVAGGAGIVLTFVGMFMLKGALAAIATRASVGGGAFVPGLALPPAGPALQELLGYWIAVSALAAAAAIGALIFTGRAIPGFAAEPAAAPAAPRELSAETRDWESIDQYSVDQVADFLMRHPNGRHAAAARANMTRIAGGAAIDPEVRAWAAIDQNDADKVSSFLLQFPNGRYASAARAKIQAAWAASRPPPEPQAQGQAPPIPPPPPLAPPPPAPLPEIADAPRRNAPIAMAPAGYDAPTGGPPRKRAPVTLIVAVAAVIAGAAAAGGYVWLQNEERNREAERAAQVAADAKASADAAAAAIAARRDACTRLPTENNLQAVVSACAPLVWDADQALRDAATAHLNEAAARTELTRRQTEVDASTFDPSAPYRDEGVCPGEGCLYGVWTARVATPLYQSPEDTAAIVTTIEPNVRVVAATGFVSSQPVIGRVSGPIMGYELDDLLYLLTDMGEATYRIWHDGRVRWIADQQISAGCDPTQPGCRTPFDFGEGDQRGHVWWAHVRLQDGRTGWVRDPSNFAGSSRHD